MMLPTSCGIAPAPDRPVPLASRIITVTLNPTLDKTLSVPRLEPGGLHRARIIRQDLGGKGINVSRALRALGIPSLLVGFLGGGTGHAMRAGLAAQGYDMAFIEVPGETRQNLTLLDEATGIYTKINEPGPAISSEQLTDLRELVQATVRPGDLWALSGSLPPGAPPELYAEITGLVQRAGGKAFLDTSGEALRLGIAAQPWAVKPNSEEAAEALGIPVQTDEEHLAAVRALQAAGCQVVCLSRGARGLILASGPDLLAAEPPTIEARSPVGAGDASLAGLLWAISEGCDSAETARRAVACGAAAAMQEGTGVGDRQLVEALARKVVVRRLSS